MYVASILQLFVVKKVIEDHWMLCESIILPLKMTMKRRKKMNIIEPMALKDLQCRLSFLSLDLQ